MRGMESSACFGGVGAVQLGVSAGFFDQPQHGVRQRTGSLEIKNRRQNFRTAGESFSAHFAALFTQPRDWLGSTFRIIRMYLCLFLVLEAEVNADHCPTNADCRTEKAANDTNNLY